MVATSKKSKESNIMMDKIKPNLIQVVLLVLVAGAAFYIGSLTKEVEYLRQGAGAGYLGGQPSELGAEDDFLAPAQVAAPDGDDFVKGNPNAKFAVIEYSDYDCPFCQQFHETAQSVVDGSDGEVMWVFRHFPLVQLHPDAERKAIESECVAQQGGNDAFWAYTDAMFTATGISDVSGFVADLGLNVSSFESCVTNRDTQDLVDADVSSGTSAGVNGTPGNFVMNLETGDAVTLFGAVPAETVQSAIDTIR